MDTIIKAQEEITIQEFIEQYHPTLTYPAIAYALKFGKITGRKEGGRWIVIVDDITLRYNPIRSKNRP